MHRSKELIIKLSTQTPDWPLVRQTPSWSGKWGNCQFVINTDVEECDFWFVYDGLSTKESTICAKENIVLLTGEPPTIKNYKQHFINQFSTILTCNRNINHADIIYSHPALPWMVGGRYKQESNSWEKGFNKDYDELSNITEFRKEKLISVIVSNKRNTKGHKKRVEFVKQLKKHFGDTLDVFGPDYKKLEDKWDGIAPYKYVIAIENSSLTDYWTEKLSDAFLGGAFPFYYGCTNIHDYFSDTSLMLIDINDTNAAINAINNCISKNSYEGAIDSILFAKHLILDRYNLFALISTYCNNQISRTNKQKVYLIPESVFANSFSDIYHKTISKLFTFNSLRS